MSSGLKILLVINIKQTKLVKTCLYYFRTLNEVISILGRFYDKGYASECYIKGNKTKAASYLAIFARELGRNKIRQSKTRVKVSNNE